MANDKSPQAVAERLLRVLSSDELNALGNTLGLQATVDLDEIAVSLGKLARFEIVRVVLKAATSTLVLLQDIFSSLASFGISARTTGFVFVLADPSQPGQECELEFSPQAIGCVSDFQAHRKWGEDEINSLDALLSRWRLLSPKLLQVLGAAVSREVEGDMDVVETVIQNRAARTRGDMPPGVIREPDRVFKNPQAESFLRFVVSHVIDVRDHLLRVHEEFRPLQIRTILREATEFIGKAQKILPSNKSRANRRESQPAPSDLRRYASFLRDFDRFREDLYLLADLIEGESIFDMLRLDIWSSRPQLFEVWVMLTILSWLSRRGYSIKPLKLEQSVVALKWRLAYSKDKEPCASVQGPPGSLISYLYYQLYRPGDMPDLALLSGPNPTSRPIWSVDPKHSEQRSYSIKEYQATAERYRDSFGAPLSIIVEYFERSECKDNPVSFGNGAWLVHNCHPGGPGLALLLTQLSRCHPFIATTLVCLDISQSFLPHLQSVLPAVVGALEQGNGQWLDDFVCFAGSAVRRTGLRAWLNSDSTAELSSLGLDEGTKIEPLIQVIFEVVQGTGINRIVLVTDGVFDVPLDVLIQRLRSEMNVSVEIIRAPGP